MVAEFNGVEDRLRQALQAGRLSGEQETRGEALLSRLVSPVRVAVLGQRRSGKTSVLNVLAGSPVLPTGLPLPTAQLMWGLPPETLVTYPDRSTRKFGVASERDLTVGAPIFLSLQRDLPALRRVALLEVVMTGDVEKQSRALAWAAARCDLVVWCTPLMDEIELHLMSTLPSALRRHAIVALTYADRLGGPDVVAERCGEIGGLLGEDTQMVRAVDARTAVMGLAQSGPSITEALRASGAEALTGAVQDKVDAGYARVREAAESLLEDAVLTAARAVAAPPAPQPSASAPTASGTSMQAAAPIAAQEPEQPFKHAAPRQAPRHSPRSHLVDAASPAKLATPAPAHRPAFASGSSATSMGTDSPAGAVPVERVPPPAPAQERALELASTDVAELCRTAAEEETDRPAALTPEGQRTVAGAIRYLTQRGSGWARTARSNPEAAGAEIMADILGDAEWLSSYLSDPFGADEPLIAPARAMAEEILDLVQLMEMEHTERATSDAVCLMLQAQRRLQAISAAA